MPEVAAINFVGAQSKFWWRATQSAAARAAPRGFRRSASVGAVYGSKKNDLMKLLLARAAA